MPRLKYFNDATQEWEYVVVGAQGPQGDAGPTGPQGDIGPQGDTGPAGPGIAAGGTAGQIIAKVDSTDYNTEWIDNYTEQVKHTVKAGESLTKGQAVYVSSANGTNMIVSKASNDGESTSSKTMGLIAQDMILNDQGFLITEGLLAGLNTASATAGDPVWLGTSGNLIYGLSNKPTAPAHLVFIGIVTRVHATNGEIFVKVQNGFELDELHDVSITSPAAGELVVRNSANTLWENMTKSEAGFATVATSGSYNDLSDKPITASSGQILYQNGSNATVGSSGLAYDGVSLKVNGNLESTYSSGDEGGEIFLKNPVTNTSISSGVTIDVWRNYLRIFENGGSNRGYKLDLTSASNTVGTSLTPGLSPIIPSSTTITYGSGSASIAADGTVTFSGMGQLLLNNVFSSAYRNYLVIFGNFSANDYGCCWFGTDGSTYRPASYNYSTMYNQNGAGTHGYELNTTYIRFGYVSGSTYQMTISNPTTADYKMVNSLGGYGQTGEWCRGYMPDTSSNLVSFGFGSYNGGAIYGTVKVYGYN